MIDFKKLMSETKTYLKSMLTKESSQEQIDSITEMDKKLDSLTEAYDQKAGELDDMKDRYIESVKNTGFKGSNSKDDSGIDQNKKSIDDIMEEELDKIVAKQGGK